MKHLQMYFLSSILVLLTACAAIGIPTPKTFNERLAVSYASVTQVRATATTLLTSQKISADDAANVLNGTDAARAGLDIARGLSTTNATAAESKLTAIQAALAALNAYLVSRGG